MTNPPVPVDPRGGPAAPQSRPPRRTRLARSAWLAAALLLGMAFLAGSLYLAGWLGPASASPTSTDETSPEGSDRGLPCLGYADLTNGITPLVPLQSGAVKELLVKEGAWVKAGTELVRQDDRAFRLRVTEARAALAAARIGLLQAEETRCLHQGQISQQQAARDAVRFRLAAARKQLRQKVQLRDLQLIPATEVAAAEDQIKELEALERVEQGRLAELQKRNVKLAIDRAQTEVDMAQARLKLARQAREECVLLAPRDGTVLRLLVGPGDVIGGATRQPAVRFAADGPILIRAEIDQEFANRVAENRTATILNDSDSRQRWTGTVTHVGRYFSPRRVTSPEAANTGSQLALECIITLDPTSTPPRINQRVRVLIAP